jgi:hypothetical protein
LRLRIGDDVFRLRRRKENHKTQRGRQARDIARGGGGDAGGKDYDDVAKVGAADRGNLRPGSQAHKDKAQFGPLL